MPSDLILKSMNAAHRVLHLVTRNRIGWDVAEMPVLELTTTGRKSGQARSVMLTSPLVDGENLAIVASAGGNDRHPAWFLNLREDPEVKVRTKDGTRPMLARILEGDERTAAWTEIVGNHRNYGGYQSKTERQIPVVLLEPVP